ncbi:hypothetical protein AX14_011264 [Amanita brunnescens Koide BX004]|nr:hypothetical protein AX14_011264 [Amanita brunnescens Koide BX004]
MAGRHHVMCTIDTLLCLSLEPLVIAQRAIAGSNLVAASRAALLQQGQDLEGKANEPPREGGFGTGLSLPICGHLCQHIEDAWARLPVTPKD